MKTYEQFQYERLDESIINRVAGAANRMRQGASKMIGGANKAMSRAGSTMGKVGRSVASSVPRAANQVQKTTSNVRKEFGQNSRAGRFKAANVLGNRNVRSGLSALKNAASNIRGKTYTGQGLTSAFTSGSGVGSEIKQGVKDRKKFEKSKVVQYNKPTKDRFGNVTGGKNASGQKLPNTRTVVQRGRELDSQNNPIDRGKRGKSLINKVTSKLRRNIGLSDIKDKTPTPPKPGESTPPTDNNRVTGPEQNSKAEAKSGPKSKGKEPVSVNIAAPKGGGTEINPKTGEKIIKKPKPVEAPTPAKVVSQPPRKGRATDRNTEGDTDKIDITGGRQQRITGGSDPVPIKQGREGKRRGRPRGSTNKTPVSPGQQTIPGLNKTGSNKGLGSKVGDAVKTGAQKAGDAVKSGAKKAGKAVKDGAVKVGKGIKDEVVSGAKELSKDIENKVAAGKKKRDEKRAKVTTNYTKPKKGEEMTVPQKKGKVTVNTSKDTANASERIIQAMDKQGKKDETNPVQQAKQDSKKPTALTGSTLDRTRSALKKTLNLGSGSSSTGKKNTQLKDMDDDTLARQSQDSDTGKFRRNASSSKTTKNKKYIPPSKTKSQNIQTQSVINQSRKKNQSGKKYSKGGDAMSGGGNQEENKNPITKKFTNTNKNKNNKNKQTNESFSHWREQFLWEVDKKYPDKVKEIKPMSGKNTITINPEDESSKYKRGY